MAVGFTARGSLTQGTANPDTLQKTSHQSDSLKTSIADTSKRGSSVRDTLPETPDSTGRMSTPALVGSVDRWLDSSQYISRDDLHWVAYQSLAGILGTFPGVYIRDQASPGQYDQIVFHGADWRSIAVTQNGRVLNDPASGVFNLSSFSAEYADRIEFISGPRAFLYGFNSAGATINLITKNYNSNRPFTKINYAEGPYNYGYSDGTFSQNVSRKVNVTFGFQHLGTDGRYLNSASDNWNIRGKIRYNPVKNLNIILSEYFTSDFLEMNGGVDIEKSGTVLAFQPQLATMKNTDSYEKITRHDLDLSLVGTLLGDTINVSTLSFYYSHTLREYRDEENRAFPNGIFILSDHTSSWMGGSLTQNFDAEFTRLSLGANLELRQIEGSPNLGRRRDIIASAYGKDDILLGNAVTVSGYGRYDDYLGTTYLGIGSDATLRITPSLTVFGGASVSNRMPNYQELYWADSTVNRSGSIGAERHLYVEAGALVSFPRKSNLRLALFHRTIHNPIVISSLPGTFVFPGVLFGNGSDINTDGIEATMRLRFWHLDFEGKATYTAQRSGGARIDDIPQLVADGGIYFWDALFNDKLELKAGARGFFRTRHQGSSFNPEVITYVPNQLTRLGVASAFDLLLLAHIGDAYIHIVWENVVNVQYFTTPYFVANDRGVRFGVSWEFLD
jgi:outer membrane cobalamin receptor